MLSANILFHLYVILFFFFILEQYPFKYKYAIYFLPLSYSCCCITGLHIWIFSDLSLFSDSIRARFQQQQQRGGGGDVRVRERGRPLSLTGGPWRSGSGRVSLYRPQTPNCVHRRADQQSGESLQKKRLSRSPGQSWALQKTESVW